MWTKDKVTALINSVEHGEEKLHNMLLELSAYCAASKALARAPQTVWFSEGFTPEQHAQRSAIISIASKISEGHRDQWLADLLNTFKIPTPSP